MAILFDQVLAGLELKRAKTRDYAGPACEKIEKVEEDSEEVKSAPPAPSPAQPHQPIALALFQSTLSGCSGSQEAASRPSRRLFINLLNW